MAKSKYSSEMRILIAQKYLDGKASSCELSNIYGIPAKTIRRWAQRLKEQGVRAFSQSNSNSHYSSEFKLMCVELYISGELSLDEIVEKGIDAAIDWLPCASWHPKESVLELKEYQYYTLTENDQLTGISYVGESYICSDDQSPYI